MFDALKKIGDAAGGLIFKDAEEGKPSAQAGKPAGIGGFSATPTASTSGGVVSVPTLNLEMVEELKKVVTKRVSAFTTLEEKSNAMAAAIPDETQRTRAAFGLLAAEGRSGADIIKAIEMHVMDVDSEQTRFANAVNAAKQTKSGGIRAEVATLEKSVNADNELIVKLQSQIVDAQARIATNQQQASEKSAAASVVEAEFDAKVAAFNNAASAVKDSLNARKAALSSVLS